MGRDEIKAFLTKKWARELDYRLIKEIWTFAGNRIAVRFAYEWHDASGQWHRSYGNENWEFDDNGLMQKRFASINDLAIAKLIANITGRSDEGRMITQACPNSACSQLLFHRQDEVADHGINLFFPTLAAKCAVMPDVGLQMVTLQMRP